MATIVLASSGYWVAKAYKKGSRYIPGFREDYFHAEVRPVPESMWDVEIHRGLGILTSSLQKEALGDSPVETPDFVTKALLRELANSKLGKKFALDGDKLFYIIEGD